MMNHHLLRFGFPFAIIEVTQRAEYLAALDEANGGNCERFARVVTSSLERTIKRVMGP